MNLAWGAILNAEERGKLVDVARAIGCDPSHLSACIMFESRWDAAAVNAASGATGLIQFMPSTARSLGTTVAELARLSRVDQLAYVYAYFKPKAGKLATLSDVYMAILWPAAVGMPESYGIFKSGSEAYRLNAALDLDPDGLGPLTRDGVVTKAEAASFVQKRLEQGLLPQNAADSETQAPAPIEDAGRPLQPVEQESTMAGFADTLANAAPVVGTIAGGPIGGLIGGLASVLIKGFAPLAQDKITQAVARHTNAETAQQVSTVLTSGVVELAQKLTGRDDPLEATIAARGDPAVMKQLEQQTLETLDKIGVFIDKIAAYEQQAFDRAEASMNAAVVRQNSSAENRQLALLTGRVTAWGLVGVTAILLGMCVVQLAISKSIDGTVATLAGGALAVLYQNVGQVFNFLFGQSPESRAALTAQAELDARRPRAQ